MKNTYLIFLLAIALVSCNNDDDVTHYRLNDFEASVIPFTETVQVDFINENAETVTTTVTAKESIEAGSEAGGTQKFYGYGNTLRFENDQEVYQVAIRTSLDNIIFSILHYDEVEETFTNLGISECSPNLKEVESTLTNVSANGTAYNNVFVFKPCSDSTSNFERIIYSVERGIEYIEFQDGSYYKQK